MRPDKSKLYLPKVTICAADTSSPELAARALEASLDRCDFADAILFSDVAVHGRFRNIRIEKLGSIAAYSRFCIKQLADYIETPYTLIVQWDGYVVEPEAWRPRFLKYDYIGAVIPPGQWQVGGPKPKVGNGGFSLRSRKLLEAGKTLPFVKDLPEDLQICVTFRRSLERDFGVRFAPIEVADRFSYELKRPDNPTFGFHGLSNFLRHEPDDEIIRISEMMPRRRYSSFGYFNMIVNSLNGSRDDLALSLYVLLRGAEDLASIRNRVKRFHDPSNIAGPVIDTLEARYRAGSS